MNKAAGHDQWRAGDNRACGIIKNIAGGNNAGDVTRQFIAAS